VLVVAGLLLTALGVTAWFFLGTYHLKTVEPGVLYRDGVQSMREFRNAVRKVEPKTVVMLVDEKEVADPAKPQFAWEVEYLRQKGVRVEHIPVKLGGYPTSDDVRRFLDVATKNENQPVLVHCAQGVRRTGMMVAAYEMSVRGKDKERAKAEIIDFGHSERTINDVKTFIDGYDPQQRIATTRPATGARG
jgi:protein tyrosine phosphatase (PTP) superfamily phosphohydrolase (DUF442 family)